MDRAYPVAHNLNRHKTYRVFGRHSAYDRLSPVHGSRTLAEYDDSRPLAQKYLEARALDMTKRLVVMRVQQSS